LASVSIRDLSKRFGGKSPTTAVDSLELEIEPGEFLVLLGPSGCGKTTTLRCIAGLETADEGRIAFGDRTVFDAGAGVNIAPNKRNIGMVFQSYALWPHMTVRKNIGYPLRARRVPRRTAAGMIEDVARLVDCSNLLDRYPGQLSGGQQQRVALSRGLVAEPELVLFDEPLSNLDARLRDQVRSEIHELHARLKFTAVYVTHDQVEALALGDRLAIMRDGKVEQLASPEQIFEEPATEYVAGFIGMGNRLTLERLDGEWTHGGIAVDGDLGFAQASTLTLRARPEDVTIARPGTTAPTGTIALEATIVDSEFGGRTMELVASVGETRLQSRMAAGERGDWVRSLAAGQPALAFVRVSGVTFFDDAGKRIPVPRAPGAARDATRMLSV
jgi:iron(III) transport system ATP-binding protein